MKKAVPILFLIFFVISGLGLIFPESFQDVLNSIFSSYSDAVMNLIWYATAFLFVVFIINLINERKNS
jgi:hypothetical protein